MGRAFKEMRRKGVTEEKALEILQPLWEAIEEVDQECTDERNMMAFVQIHESAGKPVSSGGQTMSGGIETDGKSDGGGQ